MKHTPGPWTVQRMEPDGFIIRRDDTYQISTPGYDVATYVPSGGPFRKLEDALLAASAPDLAAENERLRAVLRPFAALYHKRFKALNDDVPIYQHDDSVIRVGDVRQARAALNAAMSDEKEK